METHFWDGGGAHDESAVSLSPGVHSFHINLIPGLTTSHGENYREISGRREERSEKKKLQPWLFLVTSGVGRALERGYHRLRPQGEFGLYWKRIGEIAGAFGVSFLLTFVGPALILGELRVWDEGQIRFAALWSVVVGAILYFALLLARELIIVTGDLETVLRKRQLFRIRTALAFAFSNKVFAVGIVLLFLVIFAADLVGGTGELASYGNSIALPLRGMPFVAVAQVVTAFGVLNYGLYSGVRSKHSVPMVKRGYLEIAQTIEDLALTEVYIVLILAISLFAFDSALPGLAGVSPYWNTPETLERLFRSLSLLLVVAPFAAYFMYLSKFVADAKSTELRGIDRTIADVRGGGKDEVALKDLMERREELRSRSRWIIGVGLGSRMLLAAFLALQALVLGF